MTNRSGGSINLKLLVNNQLVFIVLCTFTQFLSFSNAELSGPNVCTRQET